MADRALGPVVEGVSGTTFASAAASHVATIPAGVERGDLLLAFGAFAADSTPISHLTPAGWTLLAVNAVTPSFGAFRFVRYARISEGNETTVDLATTQSNVVGAAQVYRIGRWKGAIASHVGISSANSETDAAPNSQSLTVGWGAKSTLWLSVGGHAAEGALATVSAYPSGYTGTHTAQGSGDLRAGVFSAYRESAVAAEDPAAFTLSASNLWLATTNAIKPEYGVHAGAIKRRVVAEIDGIEYEVDTPEQLRQLQARAHEAELARQQLRRLEEIASRKQLQRTRERMAAEAMDRQVERAAMVRIEAERAFKAKQDEIDRELVERLTLPAPIPRTRITLPKGVAPRLSSNTGLRRLGRKQ